MDISKATIKITTKPITLAELYISSSNKGNAIT
jgi:hypothetical protein